MIAQLIHKITSLLEGKDINYMISGSLALNHYVMPRMTMDLDLVIELNKNNLRPFLDLFDEKAYYLNPDSIKTEVSRHGMFNIIDFDSGLKIDFIIRKETDYRQLEFSRRKWVGLSEKKVCMVSPEDLILSKLHWIQKLESDKQKTDIKNLLSLENLDLTYIHHWVDKLNLNTFGLL